MAVGNKIFFGTNLKCFHWKPYMTASSSLIGHLINTSRNDFLGDSYSYTVKLTRDLVAHLFPSLLVDVGGSRVGVPQAGINLIVNHVLRRDTTESIRLWTEVIGPSRTKPHNIISKSRGEVGKAFVKEDDRFLSELSLGKPNVHSCSSTIRVNCSTRYCRRLRGVVREIAARYRAAGLLLLMQIWNKPLVPARLSAVQDSEILNGAVQREYL